jgi:hypothetical protein
VHGTCVGRQQWPGKSRWPIAAGTRHKLLVKSLFSVRRQYFQMQTSLTRLVATAAILVIVDAAPFDGRYIRAQPRGPTSLMETNVVRFLYQGRNSS